MTSFLGCVVVSSTSGEEAACPKGPSIRYFPPQCMSSFPPPAVFIRCPQLLSSSAPHPGRRAPSACVPASRVGPGIWPHSGPNTPPRPLSTPPPCNVVVHTSCGRHWSSLGQKNILICHNQTFNQLITQVQINQLNHRKHLFKQFNSKVKLRFITHL